MAKSIKHRSLSLAEKYELLKFHSENKMSVKDLTMKFKCGKTLVYDTIKNKEKIKSDYLRGENCNSKRKIRKTGNEEINRILYEWFLDARSRNLPISGPLLKTQAKLIAERLGNSDFKASNGWLESFRNRHEISYKQICGEAKDVDIQSVENWKRNLAEITKGYEPCNIANCDETGLFFRALPSKTMALKKEKCVGGKQSKERLTVLVCGYADGKLEKPLVIGKSTKPRCFRNLDIHDLPVEWKANKKAWMTGSLMEEWLKALNVKMRRDNRKILLFLDNAACHPHLNLSNIKLCFFPPNSTSVTQPMDQGVIQNLKLHYRKLVLKTLVSNMRESKTASELAKQISVLDAVRWIASAYKQVQPSCVIKCFQKAGFTFGEEDAESDLENVIGGEGIDTASKEEMESLMDAAGEKSVLPFEFVNVDTELMTSEGLQSIDTLIDSCLPDPVDIDEETECDEGLGKHKGKCK